MSYQIEQEVRRVAREEVGNHPTVNHVLAQINMIQAKLFTVSFENPLLAMIERRK